MTWGRPRLMAAATKKHRLPYVRLMGGRAVSQSHGPPAVPSVATGMARLSAPRTGWRCAVSTRHLRPGKSSTRTAPPLHGRRAGAAHRPPHWRAGPAGRRPQLAAHGAAPPRSTRRCASRKGWARGPSSQYSIQSRGWRAVQGRCHGTAPSRHARLWECARQQRRSGASQRRRTVPQAAAILLLAGRCGSRSVGH